MAECTFPVLGVFRKPTKTEAIPEELLEKLPVVTTKEEDASTTFAIEEENPTETTENETTAPTASPVAEQLRFDMGEAFARELDRAQQFVADALAGYERRIAEAEAALAAAQAEAEKEKSAREALEARLRAFRDLALR